MTDLEKILLSQALTILGGILIFLAGQTVVRFVLDPVVEQRKLIGEIKDRLIFYAHAYSNPGVPPRELADETAKVLRQSSSQLQARTHAIPFYDVLGGVGLVRSRKLIDEASGELIGLSNSVHDKGREIQNMLQRERIEQALGLTPSGAPSLADALSDKLSDR